MPSKNVASDSGRLPAPVVYALVAVAVIVLGIVTYRQLRGPAKPAGGATVQLKGEVSIRKCAKCGQVFEEPAEEARAKGYLDFEGAQLTDAGKRCPKCNSNTLRLAVKCPSDGTVFVPDISQGMASKAAGCPKCGWNPLIK